MLPLSSFIFFSGVFFKNCYKSGLRDRTHLSAESSDNTPAYRQTGIKWIVADLIRFYILAFLTAEPQRAR